MAKFGLYPTYGMRIREFEGDSMKMNKEFVEIYKDLPDNKMELVASVRLDKGQTVMKLSDKDQ